MLRQKSAASASGAELMEDVAIPFHIRAGREGRGRKEKCCIADVHDPSKLQ